MDRVQRFYVSPTGNSVMRSGGLLPAPQGWTEMTAEEYEAYRADERIPTRGLIVRTLAEVRAS